MASPPGFCRQTRHSSVLFCSQSYGTHNGWSFGKTQTIAFTVITYYCDNQWSSTMTDQLELADRLRVSTRPISLLFWAVHTPVRPSVRSSLRHKLNLSVDCVVHRDARSPSLLTQFICFSVFSTENEMILNGLGRGQAVRSDSDLAGVPGSKRTDPGHPFNLVLTVVTPRTSLCRGMHDAPSGPAPVSTSADSGRRCRTNCGGVLDETVAAYCTEQRDETAFYRHARELERRNIMNIRKCLIMT